MPQAIQPHLLAKQLLETNGQLASKISRTVLCQSDECLNALAEVIRFMALAAETSEGQLTPSHRVDLAWHEFILHTRAYGEFCNQHFGKFIHHHPGGDPQQHLERFQQTIEAYRKRFGNPPDGWWNSKAASCGSCDSSV